MLDAGEPQAQRVEVPLHEQRVLRLANGMARFVEIVQHPPLVEHLRLGRVEVLRLAIAQHASAEPDHAPAQVVNREQQTPPEPRAQRPALTLERQAGGFERLGSNPQPLHGLEKRRPRGREPQPPGLEGFELEPPAREVAPRPIGLARLAQLSGVPLLGNRHGLEEWLARVGSRLRSFGDRDADASRHLANGRRVVHPQLLHEEREDVPGFVAHEAVVHLLLGDDREVAMRAPVERTRSAVVGSRAPELDVLAEDLDQVGAVSHLLDDLVGDAHQANSAMVAPVPPSRGGASR